MNRLTQFCDWYTLTIYPMLSDSYGWLTDRIPFSIGELLMYAAALWLLYTLFTFLLWPFLRRRTYSRKASRKGFGMRETYTERMLRNGKHLATAAFGMAVIFLVTYILPFHSSYITFPGMENRGFTLEEVTQLRNWVVEGLNEAAGAAARDHEGHLIVPDTVDEDIVAAMRALSGEYPRLTGYYPRIKRAIATDFYQYMRIGGVTYCYTMEITGNGYDMLRLYYPCLYAHESSHHQGYYQEDEADFLSYIACSGSGDAYVRYSAFYQMYYVVEPEFRRRLKRTCASEEEYKERLLAEPMADPVFAEDMAYDQEIFDRAYAQSMIHPPEKLKQISEKVADVGWSVQEDILQEKFYSGSLGLLLQYYFAEQ